MLKESFGKGKISFHLICVGDVWGEKFFCQGGKK